MKKTNVRKVRPDIKTPTQRDFESAFLFPKAFLRNIFNFNLDTWNRRIPKAA